MMCATLPLVTRTEVVSVGRRPKGVSVGCIAPHLVHFCIHESLKRVLAHGSARQVLLSCQSWYHDYLCTRAHGHSAVELS